MKISWTVSEVWSGHKKWTDGRTDRQTDGRRARHNTTRVRRPYKKTGNGLAAGCLLFYRKIYGYFFAVAAYFTSSHTKEGGFIIVFIFFRDRIVIAHGCCTQLLDRRWHRILNATCNVNEYRCYCACSTRLGIGRLVWVCRFRLFKGEWVHYITEHNATIYFLIILVLGVNT